MRTGNRSVGIDAASAVDVCEEVVSSERYTKETCSKDTSLQMWAAYGNRFSPCEKALTQLDAGQYTIEWTDTLGTHLHKKDVILDDLLVLPDNSASEILEQINRFWTLEQRYRDLGFLWKRGILLYGPPGSGKTSCLQLLSKQIIDLGGISVYVTNPDLGSKGLDLLRAVEPRRPIVVMIEDIDAIIVRYGEPELLALLDGELQIDNVVFVATTNYPEDLDKRFKNRPSRFDFVKRIGMPSAEAREYFLKEKNPRLRDFPDELTQWVSLTKNFSIAHLKELIIFVEIFDAPLEQAVKRLRDMMEINITSEDEGKQSVGFC